MRPLLPTCLLAALLTLPLAAPAADAIPAERLDAFIDQAADQERLHALVVAVEGEVVAEHDFAGPGTRQPANIKSLSKTVLAALVGAAIEQGVIEGPDQPVVELLGERVPADVDPRVSEITVGHLLSLQAGLERTSGSHYGAWVASADWVQDALSRPFIDRPGGRMLYSTGSSHLLSAALTQASGESTLELAQRWLGEPLEIEIPAWPRDPQGVYFGGNDMQLSPRDLVRIGELYRHDGMHDGERLLPEGWVEASWTPRGRSPWTSDDYGYGWFITQLAGERVYYGRGFGGQALYVVPSRAMTVAITADPSPPSPGGQFQQTLHRLVETLLADDD